MGEKLVRTAAASAEGGDRLRRRLHGVFFMGKFVPEPV
jgi:hypothetical protein